MSMIRHQRTRARGLLVIICLAALTGWSPVTRATTPAGPAPAGPPPAARPPAAARATTPAPRAAPLASTPLLTGTVPISGTIYDVSMVSDAFGHAVGEGGVILERYNGGPWQQLTSPVTSTLYGVSMVSSDYGFAVGAGGTLLHRQGGGPWVAETSPVSTTLYDVSVVSDAYGHIVGAGGTILTRRAGGPWLHATSPTSKTLYALTGTFYYAKAVGADGTILSTRDGETWTFETSPTSETLHAITYIPPSGYWAVGAAGTILFSPLDGPNAGTWQIVPSPTAARLYSISGNARRLDATGAYGTLLEYRRGAWRLVAGSLPNRLYLPLIRR